MPKKIKRPGPLGRLTEVARECYEKGLTQAAARSTLMKQHKALENVAKVTVSHVYGKSKAEY